MSLLSRLFGSRTDPRDALRPLWYKVVELSRLREYYAQCRVADTLEGRFDMVTVILSVVLLRMEKSMLLNRKSAYLTELFIEDMDGQLRESGVGDLAVGKHMGKLMGVLGGRLGALREAFKELAGSGQEDALRGALESNVTFAEGDEGGDPAGLASRIAALRDHLSQVSDADILAGRFLQ